MRDLYNKATILALVVVPLLAVLIAIVLFWNKYVFASDLILLTIFWVIATFGVTIGYHRLLTHDSFQCPTFIKALFLIAGCSAFEGAPIPWAATHIKHHAHSDHEDDPHSPLEGFWHAHMGWMFQGEMAENIEQYAPQLLKDKTIVFINRTCGVWMALSLLIPFAIGGWTALVWAGGVRIFLNTHITWSVNSICHTFGSRDFDTTDESRNNWIVGLLAFGEGWHNNHHAFPKSAFHGMRWWQVDFSSYFIWTLEKLGLAWKVQRVSREAQEAHALRSQTMNDAVTQLREELAAAIDKAKKDLAKKGSEAQQVAMERLHEIQDSAAKRRRMKKHKLQAYLQEVKDITTRIQSAKA